MIRVSRLWLLRRSRAACAATNTFRIDCTLAPHNSCDVFPTSQSVRSFSLAQRVWDVLRTGNLNPPNPVLKDVLHDDEGRSPSALPNFSRIQPHHLVRAAEQVRDEYELNFSKLQQKLELDQNILISEPERLLNDLEQLEAPSAYVLNVASLYHSLVQTPQWQQACGRAIELLSERPHEHSHMIMETLERIQEKSELASSALEWTVRYYLQNFQRRGIRHAEESSLQSLQNALDELQSRFIAAREDAFRRGKPSSAASTRDQLQDLYAFVAIRSQQAKLLGFDHYAQMILSDESRMANSVREISSLHKKIAEHVAPIVENTSVKSWEEIAEAEIDMREYLTLDGVLGGLFGLSRAMFGIRIQEDTGFKAGWHNDVRLFHIMEEESDAYMASFYLDPYRRPVKSIRPLMGPLVSNRLTFVSCNIRPPAWDHLPTALQMEDALFLAHEFGHLLQFALAGSHKSVLGAQNMPLDVTEVMPQFMEHWLFDESVLQTLAHLSQADKPVPEETIEVLKKQRSLQKTRNMMHRIFLGQLELDMFSNAREEDESLVTLQRRLAIEFISHDLPPKSDLTPMLEIIESNAQGKPVSQYRYLMGEVLSADLFTMFQEAGIKDQARMRELGTRQLKETFLKPGATLDAREAFAKMRGRDVSPDALLRMYGS